MALGASDRTYVVKLGLPGSTGLSTNVADTTIQDYFVVPFKSRLFKVQYIATGVAGAAGPILDVHGAGATTVSSTAGITIAASDTVYADTLKTGSEKLQHPRGNMVVAKDTAMSLRAYTDGTGAIITPAATLCFTCEDPTLPANILVLKMSIPGSTGLGSAVALTTTQAYWIAPTDCELIICKGIGLAKAGTTDPKIDVYCNGATMLSTNITIAGNATVYNGVVKYIATGTRNPIRGYPVKAGDKITMRCFTHATAGELTTPSVTCVFRY